MADPKLTIVGDTDKAQQAIVALEKKFENLQNKMRHLNEQAKKNRRGSQEAFGASALSEVANYAAGFISLTAAISAATVALQKNETIKNEAAAKQRAASAGLASLSQLATNAQELQSLVNESRDAYGKGVGTSVNEAANLIFNLTSAGIEGDDRKLMVDLAANQVLADTAGFALAANALQKAVGKQITGGFADIASKAFAASAASPATVDQLLVAAARSGGNASRLGITDAELLAATAVTATPAGSAAEGGTQLRAMLAAMEKQGGFDGLGLEQSLLKIQGMNLQGADLLKFFGSTEAVAGYSSLSGNLDFYKEVAGNVNRAQQEGLVFQRLELPSQVTEIEAANINRRAVASVENQRIDEGTLWNLREAAFSSIRENVRQEDGAFWAAEMDLAEGVARYNPFRSDEGFLRDSAVQRELQNANPELLQKILGTLERIEKHNANQLNEQKQQRQQRIPRRNEG